MLPIEVNILNPLTGMDGFLPAHSRCKASGTEFSNNCVIWLEALFCSRNPPRWEGSGWSVLFTGEQIAKGPGSDLTTGWLWRGQVTTWPLCLSLFPYSVSHMVLLMSQREQLLSSAYNSSVWALTVWFLFSFYKACREKGERPFITWKGDHRTKKDNFRMLQEDTGLEK